MAGNNCDDAFQQAQELREQNRKLAEEMAQMARQLRAAGTYTAADHGNRVLLPGRRGLLEVDDADIRASEKQLAALLDSDELQAMVDRGIEQQARPVGREGLFQNYDRMLREVQLEDLDGYAKLAEALGIMHERVAPGDYALLTEVYGPDRTADMVERYLQAVGISDPEVMARAATIAARSINAVENKVWLRFWADRSKRVLLDAMEEARDRLAALPGAEVPKEQKREVFRQYKLALALERHNNFVTRKHAQALRSQQDAMLGIEAFRLDGDDAQAVADSLGMTGADIDADSVIGRFIQAADDRDAEQMTLLIDAIASDGIDPKSRLDAGWFNTHMRLANALVKDSQLMNLNTQLTMNAGSNAVMMAFGPIEQTLLNGHRLIPVGTKLQRPHIVEAARISSSSLNYALTTLKATWRRDLARVFRTGVSHYSGNIDAYGLRLLTNAQELADMQGILDMPYQGGDNWTATLLNPNNMGLFTNKLQVAARILALTKPGGTLSTGMGRIEAAWTALGLGGTTAGIQRLRISQVDAYTPWKPALRAMAATDEVFGRFHYLFKLKADLEVKARMEGNQLGLFDDRSRAEWVQKRIDEAIYQISPTEANVKAYRQQFGIRGSDLTDDQIIARISEENLVGAPTLATQESVDAMNHSARMRFQDAPGDGSLAQKLDRGVAEARQDWRVDRFLMPYWRSPFMGMLFDWRLSTFGIIDTLKMVDPANRTPEALARVKAGWVMAGGLFGVFGMLDAAGLVHGALETNPDKRNTIAGVRLAGLPVMNTLMLWKDVQTVLEDSGRNEYDGNEMGLAVMKLLTGQITRQAGIQQVQLLLEAMLDGTQSSWEKVRRAIAFIGSGQVPFIGVERNIERLTGTDRTSFFRDRTESPMEQFYGADDPLANLERTLKNFAYDTLPASAAFTGGQRKTADHLGSPIGHIWGINFAKGIPFVPSVWPKGQINEVVYGELDRQDRLDPPAPLLNRQLGGLAMSDALQAEYNQIHGTITGRPDMPPTARLPISGRQAAVSLPFITTVRDRATGMRLDQTTVERIDLTHKLDRYTNGRTKKEAFYALFSDGWYQGLESDPKLSANPSGGLPAGVRRNRIAQRLIEGITDYYDLLTRDEIQKRADNGQSAAAKEWSDQMDANARQATQGSEGMLRRLGPALNP